MVNEDHLALPKTSEDFPKMEEEDLKIPVIDSIGHDLALMSLTNHTILSRGSFSYYASILSGSGVKILPCHFQAYQDPKVNIHHICYRDPLLKPLGRLYPITK